MAFWPACALRKGLQELPGKARHGVPVGVFMIVRGVGAAAFAPGDQFHDVAGEEIVLRVFHRAGEGLDEARLPVRRREKACAIGPRGLALFGILTVDGHAHREKARGDAVQPVAVAGHEAAQLCRVGADVDGAAHDGRIKAGGAEAVGDVLDRVGADLVALLTHELGHALGDAGRLAFFRPIHHQDMHALTSRVTW